MTQINDCPRMTEPTDVDASWPELQRVRRAMVVVDVVESVRLMQAYEVDVIDRWRRLVNEIRTEVLPPLGGRMVKSLGDGMLLEFASVRCAAQAVLDIQRRAPAYNLARAPDAALFLRAGAHVGQVVVDESDTFGHMVNLTARLAAIAGPGEVVVSADFRDDLVPGLDPQVEDLGECQLRNVAGTVRAFRLGPVGSHTGSIAFDTLADGLPTLAVLPFECGAGDSDAAILGEVVFDRLIGNLALSSSWRVISRLSTMALRDRRPTMADIGAHLHATFVLSGTCRTEAGQVRINAELAEVASQTVVWTGAINGTVADALASECELSVDLAHAVASSIFSFELRRSRSRSLPTLASHTLMFGAIALMHRLSRADFERSRQLLDHLCERHPRSPDPHAWLAKWHVMNVVQGWTKDVEGEAVLGRACAKRALDESSDHALGLAVDGLVAAVLAHDLDTSEQQYATAISANPNEALAWLFMSALHVYRGRGEKAAEAAETAVRLSPLDPMRYFFDSFASHAFLAAGRLEDAIRAGERSVRANCTHMPTMRSLAIAQLLAGRHDESRATVRRLLSLEPSYTVAAFNERYPGAGTAHAGLCAQALREAGLPL